MLEVCKTIFEKLGLFAAQNCLRIRGKKLCVHEEDAKIHKTEDISVNNGIQHEIF